MKRNIKRASAITVALVLLFALAIPALARGYGSDSGRTNSAGGGMPVIGELTCNLTSATATTKLNAPVGREYLEYFETLVVVTTKGGITHYPLPGSDYVYASGYGTLNSANSEHYAEDVWGGTWSGRCAAFAS